jgi:outer membrane protein OmpA-like peptidoglycan-associated protein
MLGDLELQQVQLVGVDADQVFARHQVPALEGDFLQLLGRRASRVACSGVLTGPTAGDGLKALRDKFRAAEPVTFTADIATATRLDQVLIEEMTIRELAGRPERFEYAFTLREYLPAQAPVSEEPPPPEPPPPPSTDAGIAEVQVLVEGQPEADVSGATLTVDGPAAAASAQSRTPTERTGNTWSARDLVPGIYTARAVVATPQAMAGTAETTVSVGQTSQVTVNLHPGVVIASAFMVHFRFDKAFVEPCMRAVLRQVADYAGAHNDQKLLVVGHTDKTDTRTYNQSLSERRARAVRAWLTSKGDPAGARAEWKALRQRRTADAPLGDNWATREYQHILQDLGFYPGPVDGDDGGERSLTKEAIRAFRCEVGLPPGTVVDDATWDALIDRYLAKDALNIPADRFMPNCDGSALKWLGCGEDAPPPPAPAKPTANRPYRRVELLFVNADRLPRCVPRPDTFDLPEPGAVGSDWPDDPKATSRCGFATRDCTKPEPDRWCIELAEPQTITVNGSIRRENGEPLGEQKFVIITPDGEFLQGEQSSGEPRPGRITKKGTFSFKDKRVGVYSLEVLPRGLARLAEGSDEDITGNTVCKRLQKDGDTLDVVVVDAPVKREITLPVVAHLMTALHPVTRQVRTCPDPLKPGVRIPQRTARTPAEIRAAVDAANAIWRQARIRFDLVDVVETVYADPNRPECFVETEADPATNQSEFSDLMFGCSYPNVVNVFFFGIVHSTGEAGVDVKMELQDPAGNVVRTIDGLAIGDQVLLQLFSNFPPVPVVPGERERAIVLSHELGHYLGLKHADESPANARRLMLPNLGDDHDILVAEEVELTRASPYTACVQLSLEVTGAVRIGGSRSHEFVTLRQAGQVVTVDAKISDALVQPGVGTLSMRGGDGGTDRQRTVNASSRGVREIVAVYTPAGGGVPVEARAVVTVAEFALRVEGAVAAPGGTTFVATRDPSALVTVVAEIGPAPMCIPSNLVTWGPGGTPVDDPLQRTVSRAAVARTTVTVTFAGTTLSRTILVVEAALTQAAAPFAPVAAVQPEGLLNSKLGDVKRGDLFGAQPGSLFIAVADVPIDGNEPLPATLTSLSATGAVLERRDLSLTRQRQGGNRFVSLPLLAVPSAIPRDDITMHSPRDLEVIRVQAGGTVGLEAGGPALAGQAHAQARARGHVVRLFVRMFTGSGDGLDDFRRHLQEATRVWAQAGLEVREGSAADRVDPPEGLLDLDHESGRPRTKEERQLVGDEEPKPERSATNTDLNIYYVRTVEGPAAGVSYGDKKVIALGASEISNLALAHEIGHQILVGWGDEHVDPQGKDWPRANVMFREDTGTGRDLDRTQVENILRFRRAHAILVVVQ